MLRAYEAFAEEREPSGSILVNWGRALAASGEHGKALELFTEAIRREPQNANAHFNAGDLLYAMGAYAEAAQSYESALRVDPANADGWFVLGNALARLDLPDGAKIAYGQALALAPDHPGARGNLEILSAA
jgi:tetratricopeptide (TPR) repeat protein